MKRSNPSRNRRTRMVSTVLLTSREREVCKLAASGHTNVEIARRLGISVKTVESHRKHVMSKLALRRRADLVRYALAHGLLASPLASVMFRYCPTCRADWYLRGEFLSDPGVTFHGYQTVNGGRPGGVLLFTHLRCGTSLPCPLEWFQELTRQPLLVDSCTTTGKKEKHCLATGEARTSCPLRCVCAFVWRISRIIRRWPKDKSLGPSETSQ